MTKKEALEQPAQMYEMQKDGTLKALNVFESSWKGLTDDEIAYIVNDTDTLFELEDFARAIEQASRIKNAL